jgi:hypothetical protein
MDSPIDPRLWKYMFHGLAGLTIARVAFSLYAQRRDALGVLNEDFANLKKNAGNNAEVLASLQNILNKVLDDAKAKKGCTKLAVYGKTSQLVGLLKYKEDNLDVVELLLKLVLRVYAPDAEGRKRFHQSNGYRAVMSVLSEAHKAGNRNIMQDAASTLHALTVVDDGDVVLAADVPAGAEGTYALAQLPSLTKMLRLLDPNSTIMFLNSISGIFANVCGLSVGAKAVAKGTNGQSGVSFFLRLLDHGNQGVLEHSAAAIRYLIRSNESHAEISEADNVRKIASILDVNKDPKITNIVLTIILLMTSSPQRSTFFKHLERTDALPALFTCWCRAVEKTIRDRAELLVHVLERLPECSHTIRRLMETNRSNILERKAKDEEARRKQMQQMKQQQMMQQMMMQQMMGGGDGGMDMAAMMGGED